MATMLQPAPSFAASEFLVEPPQETLSAPLPKRAPAKRGKKRYAWKVALVVGVGTVFLLGARRSLTSDVNRDAEISATVTRADLPIRVTERGQVESAKSVDVRCEVEGYQNKVVTILAEGTRVKKGDVVLTFDSDTLSRSYVDQQVRWNQAEGRAKAAVGDLELAKNKAATDIDKAALVVSLAELDREKYVEGDYKVELEERNGDAELARKDLQDSKEKLEGYRKFVKRGFGTPQQLRVKEMEVARNQYTLSSKEAKLNVLKAYTKKRQEAELASRARDAKRELERLKRSCEASIRNAQNTLDAYLDAERIEKRALERLKQNLDRCTVHAPQDGIVVYSKDRYWDPASRIGPGAMVYYQQTLFSLPDLTQMQVKVRVHEAMVKKIQVGQKAELRTDAFPDQILHGTVTKVASMAESNGPYDDRGVKEYTTVVAINDLPPDAGLKPGMTAEVKIHAKLLNDVLIVPVQSVTKSEDHHITYVIGKRGIDLREISIGENNDKYVEITGGLADGEKVVLDARARLSAESQGKETKGDDAPRRDGGEHGK